MTSGPVGRVLRSLREFLDSPADNSVTRFAWGLAGVISLSLVVLNWKAIDTLSARDWCAQIMTTEKYLGPDGRLSSEENIRLIIKYCAETGQLQIEALAWVARVLAIALGLVPAAVFVVKFSGASVSSDSPLGRLRLGSGDSALREAAHEATQEATDRVIDAAQPSLHPEPVMPPADDERIRP